MPPRRFLIFSGTNPLQWPNSGCGCARLRWRSRTDSWRNCYARPATPMFGSSFRPPKYGGAGLLWRHNWAGDAPSGSFCLVTGKGRVCLAKHQLSALQQDFLRAFFQRENRFFLTGGAALVGFHLGHRETHDLDLFTLEDVIPEGMAAVAEVARELGGALEALQTAPTFRRVLLRRGAEAIVIDLVREYVAQVEPDKPLINGIRVDPPQEILANKLCALLSRSEIRDLVDVRALELAGYRLEDALNAAATKDSGLTPAQLGWVLSQIELGNDLIPPGEVSVEELRLYLDELIDRLTHQAFPKSRDDLRS